MKPVQNNTDSGRLKISKRTYSCRTVHIPSVGRVYVFLMYKEQTLQDTTTPVQHTSISLPAAYLTQVLSIFSSLGVTQIMIASGKLNHTSVI